MLKATDKVKNLLAKTVKQPQLVLEVEGLPVFSSTPLEVYATYGQPYLKYGDENLIYGGLATDLTAKPYIDISKSTSNINQQLLIDKGGYSSVTSFKVCLIDKNSEVTELITPKKIVSDVLGRKARLYFALEGGGHPVDSILFFSGIISDIESGAGNISLTVSSAEKLKSSTIFPKITTELSATINNSVTTIPVVTTSDFILPADSGTLKSYIKIEDEIIEFTGKTGTTFTGCTRGMFGTIATSHDIESSVESFYRLQGNLRDLSLKLMLSGGAEFYASDIYVDSFNVNGSITAANAIFINDYDIDQKYGVVVGDEVTVTNSYSNNGVYTILNIVSHSYGTYLVVDGTILNEGSGAKIKLKSKYNVLPEFAGLGMTPDQVDVVEFETIFNQYNSKFFSYDFYIKDEKDGSEFINTQILYPSGCYSLPRKAKTSIGIMTPPLAKFGTKKLSNLNIVNADQIKINRSISKNFYNAVVYKYDPDAVEDKYTKGKIYLSTDSVNRIKVGNRPLSIESDGIRNNVEFQGIFESQAERFLKRYQYGAEYLDVKVLYGDGFLIEIGDTVILDGMNLNISDTKDANGTRVFYPRLFEVQNKSMSLKGDPITLTLVDTAYSLDGRYGVISPSSRIKNIKSPTQLVLESNQAEMLKGSLPTTKWNNYVGQRVLIHDVDWTWQQEVTFVKFDTTEVNGVVLDTALVGYPVDKILVMDTPKYSGNANDKALYKATHFFFNRSVVFNSMTGSNIINLDISDIVKFKVGYSVRVRNNDYSNMSKTLKIVSIVGTSIELSEDLDFMPQPQARIDILTFPDNGTPYLLF